MQIQIHVPNAEVRLQQPPPAAGIPSDQAFWMGKFARLLQPVEGEPGYSRFYCVLPGTLAEVTDHLWQQQTLWMSFTPIGSEAQGQHMALHMSELIEASSADVASGTYENSVTFGEDALEGLGPVTASIRLKTVKGDASVLPPAFVLTLQLCKGSASMIARAFKETMKSQGELRIRCGGVRQTLDGQVQFTLVPSDRWTEIPRLLAGMDLFVQVPLEASPDPAEFPLDLSPLITAISSKDEDSQKVTATLHSELPVETLKLALTASVSCVGGSNQTAGFDEAKIGEEPTDLCMWRFSLEMRSLKLTHSSANAFVKYAYEILHQPRAFRTNPPVPCRKNTNVYLPHGFSAYTMTQTSEQLKEGLKRALRVEVWHRDTYKADSLLGYAEVALAKVFDQELQHSATKPSMAQGFRTLDVQCPIIGVQGTSGPIGVVRVVCFLEVMKRIPMSQPQLPSAREVKSEPPVRDESPAGKDGSAPSKGDEKQAEPVAAGLKMLRSSPEYSAAFELEMWRRTEESKFRQQQRDQEAARRAALEEEYEMREQRRAEEFTSARQELQSLESKVRQKLHELQRREARIAAEEERVHRLAEDTQRRAEQGLEDYQSTAKRVREEADHMVRLEKDRSQHFQHRIQELDHELSATKSRCSDLDAEIVRLRAQFNNAPAARFERELLQTQLELKESRREAAAFARSRDHFRRTVEDLCARLDRPAKNPSASLPSTPVQGMTSIEQWHQESDVVSHTLHKIQDELGKLAKEWEPSSTNGAKQPGSSGLHQQPRQPRQLPSKQVVPPASSTQDGGSVEEHASWLLQKRKELLESGLYSEDDAVFRALDAQMQ